MVNLEKLHFGISKGAYGHYVAPAFEYHGINYAKPDYEKTEIIAKILMISVEEYETEMFKFHSYKWWAENKKFWKDIYYFKTVDDAMVARDEFIIPRFEQVIVMHKLIND